PRAPVAATPAPRLVSAPVRIADAAAVGLLRPGDLVDVIAAPALPAGPGSGGSFGSADAAGAGAAGRARVVASGVRVAAVPEPSAASEPPADGSVGGALVVLSVPRPTATALAGAAATSRLAVVVC
ncbi:RcpC/CpaB family pilus assembly protein, partial [Streptomyces sp. NPDC058953]